MEQAQTIAVPSALSGRIAEEDQADFYRFQAQPDQELAFEVVEGVQRMRGDLRRAPGFTLELTQPDGSWFDAERRVKLGTANTATLHKFISAYKPRLIHRFAKGGGYTLEVRGEPGASYQLQIGAPADFPPLVRPHGPDKLAGDRWQERGFSRRLEPDRLGRLRARSGGSVRQASLAVMEKQLRDLMGLSSEEKASGLAAARPAAIVREQEPNDDARQALPVSIPSIVEGAIAFPGDVDQFRFELKEGRDLAFEIETPERHFPTSIRASRSSTRQAGNWSTTFTRGRPLRTCGSGRRRIQDRLQLSRGRVLPDPGSGRDPPQGGCRIPLPPHGAPPGAACGRG